MPILDQYGRPIARPRRSRYRELLARYDAAQTTDDNYKHWSMADALSADAAHSEEVRRRLRNRARYETQNNSYCLGMVTTLSNDVIGTGPRIEIRTGDDRANTWIEREISEWSRAATLAKQLRTTRKAKCTDGEGLLLATTARLGTPVQLYYRDIECDMLGPPGMNPLPTKQEADGIRFGPDGRPTHYYLYDEHPGDRWSSMISGGRWIDARDLIHLFRKDRPGQHRGIPEITPALPLFSQLRRWTLAVLAAAETAADFAGMVETPLPQGPGMDTQRGDMFDTFELAQRMITVLPEGTKFSQVKAEFPPANYGEVKREILAEAYAAIVMPYNVGAHDSSGFNFASGKLDRLGYCRAIEIERFDWYVEAVRPVVLAWLDEAFLIPGYMPAGLPPIAQWTIEAQWDGLDDIDAVKEATANEIQLRSGQISHITILAKKGVSWEDEQQRAAAALGMDLKEYRRRLADKLFDAPKPGPAAANSDPAGDSDANVDEEVANAAA